MSTELPADGPRRRFSRRTRRIVIAIVVVILAPLLWLAIRGYIAYDALLNAEADVGSLKAAVSTGDLAALPYIYDDMKADTESAASMTSDPIWGAATHLPGVGNDFGAVRGVASTINSLVIKGVGPLANKARGFNVGDFLPKHGQIDLARVEAFEPALDSAYSGVQNAVHSANAIDTTHTVGPLRNAVVTLQQLLASTSGEVKTINDAFQLIPPALGQDGPRDYLIALGNNASDRPNGGAVSSVALIRIDNGAVSLVRVASASSLGIDPSKLTFQDEVDAQSPFVSRHAPIATDGPFPLVLPDPAVAELQPNYSVSARSLRAAWATTFGDNADAVLSIDSTGLGYLATASGNVSVGGGRDVVAGDLTTYLQHDIFTDSSGAPATADDVSQQEDVALASVLGNVIDGSGSSAGYLSAAGHLFTQKRLLVWSELASEQKMLGTSPIGGALSTSNAKVTTYGLFFTSPSDSDSPGLTAAANLTPVLCTSAKQKTSDLSVTLTSTSKTLITEDILVYGPVGFSAGRATVTDGTILEQTTITGQDRPIDLLRVTVAPGGMATLDVTNRMGTTAPSTTTEIRTTPRANTTALAFSQCR